MDPINPLALLTRDGWFQVLARLKHPRDFWNASNVNSLFQMILQSDLKENWMSANFFATFSHFCKYLCKSDVLKLRRVNKSTKSTVDYYLEAGEIDTFTRLPKRVDLTQHISQEPFQFEKIDSLVLGFKKVPIAKLVGLSVNCEVGTHGTLSNCLPFFQNFGGQVLDLSIRICDLNMFYEDDVFYLDEDGFPNLRESFKNIGNILTLTPKLRTLIYSTDLRADREAVQNGYCKNPLPELQYLESLDMGISGCWLAEAFLQTCGTKLRRLTLQELSSCQPLTPMPHLQFLSLVLTSQEELQILQSLESPLKEIRLTIWSDLSLSPLFSALESFKDTLQQLSIRAEYYGYRDIAQLPDKIDFPFVEHLELLGEFSGKVGPSLSFLKGFGSLKTFKMDFHCRDEWFWGDQGTSEEPALAETHIISDYKVPSEEEFCKSSIWTLLPGLKCVKIGFDPDTDYWYPKTYHRDNVRT